MCIDGCECCNELARVRAELAEALADRRQYQIYWHDTLEVLSDVRRELAALQPQAA